MTLATASTAVAQPEPSSEPHPRLFLDKPRQEALRSLAQKKGSAVNRAIALCTRRGTELEQRSGYEGFRWGANLSSCAVAWRATGDEAHAKAGLIYLRALLDDRRKLGDGKGGDEVVRRDHGYPIRTYALYTAIGYDWLYDAPGMTAELKSHALQRLTAWTSWYREHGYLRDRPGANYHAGYVGAATFAAIAIAGEAGAASTELWNHVVNKLWLEDMRGALSAKDNGVLVGGDWPEGWQYGPLSVLEYALAGNEMVRRGVVVPGLRSWTNALLLRHVHSLTPGTEEYFIVGDSGEGNVHLPPNGRVLSAVITGPADDKHKAWARAEHQRLELKPDPSPIWDVLRELNSGKSQPFPRADQPTSYFAPGTGNFYTRTDWSKNAASSIMHCNWQRVPDHEYIDAGNFLMVRGGDSLIIDPTPYEARSTLTSNAPSIESAILPLGYRPSQGYWGKTTRFHWTRQTASGISVARCDYEDQYEYKKRQNNVEMAVRDFVLIPDQHDLAAVILDRAVSGDVQYEMYLRFRTLGGLALDGTRAQTTIGKSKLIISKVYASSGTPEVRTWKKAGCSKMGELPRGSCPFGRFVGDEYKLVVAGPAPQALHVLDLVGAEGKPSEVTHLQEAGYNAVVLQRGSRRTAVIAPTELIGAGGKGKSSEPLSYKIPAGATHHVVLDAPHSGDGTASVTATKVAQDCEIKVEPSGTHLAKPLIFAIDATCKVSAEGDLTMPSAARDLPTTDGSNRSERGSTNKSSRGCGCQAGDSHSGGLGMLVLLGLAVVATRPRRAR